MTYAQRNAVLAAKIKRYTEASTRSKAAAMSALVREGFYLPNGEPAPAFAPENKGRKAKA